MLTPFSLACDSVVNANAWLREQSLLIYGWHRDNAYLYIGATTRGRQRFNAHDIVGKVEPIQIHDEFHFWQVQHIDDLLEYEAKLIQTLRPKYNVVHSGVFKPRPVAANVKFSKAERQALALLRLREKRDAILGNTVITSSSRFRKFKL